MVLEKNRVLVIRHETCSNLGLLGSTLQPDKTLIRYLDPAEGEVLSEPITDYSHLVILGGPISAYEDDLYPYLRYEFELVEKAIANTIPTLGICLGSQILAKVLGANVYRGTQGREAGWRHISLTEAGQQDPLFHTFPQRFQVFESHQDTFDLPKGCVHLASSDMYPNQAFRYQTHVWSLQFHLEIGEALLLDCAAIIEKELEESQIQDTTLAQLLEDARAHEPSVKPLANTLMQQFLQIKVGAAV
ncbi:MAG TPA: type 1 glutamine amidotransferase [Crinalium sp.]|jgi:GMP synthase-like glutamine amidotransferase